MHTIRGRFALRTALLCLAFASPSVSEALAESISIRTGPGIRYTATTQVCNTGFPTPFTSADFLAARTGAVATVGHRSPWRSSLNCDPSAQWITVDAAASDRSALYALPFTVETCCIPYAELSVCWSVDDHLGDNTGPILNPAGVYLNEVPITAVAGGNWSGEFAVTSIDVTGSVRCGENVLYVYQRDWGCAIAGVVLSAQLNVLSCTTPVRPESWGRLKITYR